MSNTNIFETKLSNRMQVVRYSVPVYAALASFEERSKLSDGEAVVRPYMSKFNFQDYTQGTDLTTQNYTETSETLTVNQKKATAVPVYNYDEIQHKTNLMNELAGDLNRALAKVVDADYLAEVANATSTLDAGDVGGTSGSPIDLDATNVLNVYSAARRKLKLQDVDITGMTDPRPSAGNMKPGGQAGYAAVNPYFYEQLVLSLQGRETSQGDQVGVNSYMSKYNAFDNYETTNGYWTGTIGLATQPTDGDTVVINGVTFTFKTTLGTTAGNVLIGASAATANTNLAALINAPGTTTAQGVALSAANQILMKRISATAAATETVVVAKGYGYVVVSETFTDTTDAWDEEVSHQMFGQKGCVDMVTQSEIGIQVSDIPKELGKWLKPNTLYGLKTFTEGANAMVDVEINSSTWV